MTLDTPHGPITKFLKKCPKKCGKNEGENYFFPTLAFGSFPIFLVLCVHWLRKKFSFKFSYLTFPYLLVLSFLHFNWISLCKCDVHQWKLIISRNNHCIKTRIQTLHKIAYNTIILVCSALQAFYIKYFKFKKKLCHKMSLL